MVRSKEINEIEFCFDSGSYNCQGWVKAFRAVVFYS